MASKLPFSASVYQKRRGGLIAAMKQRGATGIALLLGNKELGMSYRDNPYPVFVQDSSFAYYAGHNRPNLALCLDIETGESFLVGESPTMTSIIRTGPEPVLQELAQMVAIEGCLTRKQCAERCRQAEQKKRDIHMIASYRAEHTLQKIQLFSFSYQEAATFGSDDLACAIASQRVYKSPEELQYIEESIDISVLMHHEAMKYCQEGCYEYEIVAQMQRVVKEHNAHEAFPIICTKNGQTLHNHYHHNKLVKEDLLLIDAGARRNGYAGDLSSTISVGGTFSAKQQSIYDLQIVMHQSAIDQCKPGLSFMELYRSSSLILLEGLRALGLVTGNVDDAFVQGAHKLFFPHSLGHMMGMDVHDMENLSEKRIKADGVEYRLPIGSNLLRDQHLLQTGFVLTIEPGIYFIPELIDQRQAQRRCLECLNYQEIEQRKDFGGIRNEENIVITDEGCKILGSRKKAMTIKEIESVRRGKDLC